MGWWFGRKSAPADARPFVPAWLKGFSEEEGFARSQEGMQFYVRATGTWAVYRAGAWELGTVRGASLVLGGEQVVGSRCAAIASPSRQATGPEPKHPRARKASRRSNPRPRSRRHWISRWRPPADRHPRQSGRASRVARSG